VKALFISAFISLSLLPSLSIAQFAAGIKGGIELSTLRRDDNLNLNGGRVGFAAGVFAKKNMGELGWFIQPEILYVSEGDNTQKLDYLKIPIMLGFDVSEDVNIHGGYNLAILVGPGNEVKEAFSSTNHQITLGMEFQGFKNGFFGIRLNYGASNIVEDPATVKNFTVHTLTSSMYMDIRLIGKEKD
jgi:hypothetical protein